MNYKNYLMNTITAVVLVFCTMENIAQAENSVQQNSNSKLSIFKGEAEFEVRYFSTRRAEDLGKEACMPYASQAYSDALANCYNAGNTCCGGPKQQDQWLDLLKPIYKSPGFLYISSHTLFLDQVKPYIYCKFEVGVIADTNGDCEFNK